LDGELTQRLTFEVNAPNQGLIVGDPKYHLIAHDERLRDIWRGIERLVSLNQGCPYHLNLFSSLIFLFYEFV